MGRVSKAMLLCLLMAVAPFAGCFGGDDEPAEEVYVWVDPVTEIEDDNHSHSDLMAHRLQTPNVRLIDYHNLNCDGNWPPGRRTRRASSNAFFTSGRCSKTVWLNIESKELSSKGNSLADPCTTRTP